MAAPSAKPRSSKGQDEARENCVSGATERELCQYPHPYPHPPSSEDVLREVEERLLASPHIPEEWWILGPPTFPPYDPDADLSCYGDSCAAPCHAAYGASGCGQAHGCESEGCADNRECPKFHVDVDLHVAAAGVEDGGEACMFGGCECQVPACSSAPAEASLVAHALPKAPLESLPDVVDNCSERELCVEEATGDEKGLENSCRDGSKCGGGGNRQVGGGPSKSHKRRTIYV